MSHLLLSSITREAGRMQLWRPRLRQEVSSSSRVSRSLAELSEERLVTIREWSSEAGSWASH